LIDVYNRLLVIILKLALLGAAILTLVFLLGVKPTFLPGAWLQDYASRLNDLSAGQRGIAIAASIAAILVAFFGLILELPRRRERALTVEAADRGSVAVSPKSIRMLVDTVTREVEGVRDVESDVRDYSGGVSITVRPTMVMGTPVPQAAREIQARAKEAVERMAGLPVSEVRVVTHYHPSRDHSPMLG
jgi:uncharacterized alkaline shock family protein YloU